MDLSLFNPRFQSEADFVASFVARNKEFAFFVEQLRALKQSQAAKHHLIVAPRGFGKTSLLRRVAIAVQQDDDLSKRFIALSFREEQHNVISLDVFWRNCLQSLLETRDDEHAPAEEIDEIDAAWRRLAPRQNLRREEQNGEPAWQEFQSRCERLGRRPILLLDNLDTLLAGLPSDHQWSLRRCLQRPDGPVLLSAASRYADAMQDSKEAFYDFCRIHTLGKLDTAEVLTCLRSLAERRGASGRPVLELLDCDPGRVAALNTLAGGNPRTLGVLYVVLESHMSTDVMSQLAAMLDTFTGWYQARTEELPMQSRAVFDALALNWDPMTAAALGEATGLDTTAVSSHLSRLERAGYVETVSLSSRGKGRNGYQVAERFFNIWYLMRNGPRQARQRIKFLAVCLKAFYTRNELRDLAQETAIRSSNDPAYVLALANSVDDPEITAVLLQSAEQWPSDLHGSHDYQQIANELRADNAKRPRSNASRQVATVRTVRLARPHWASYGTSTNVPTHAQLEEALLELEQVIAQLDGETETACRARRARALFDKGVTLGQLGRTDEEGAAYDRVVVDLRDAIEPSLRVEVARALFMKGVALSRLGRTEQAIEVYDEVIANLGHTNEPALREQVADALRNKGVALSDLGQPEKALAAFEELLARFDDGTRPDSREQIAHALSNKAVALGQLGQTESALVAYDELAARFGDATEPALREQVARALFNKGSVLGRLGRTEQAISAYDEVSRRFGDATAPALLEQVARALVNKGSALDQIGRIDEVITIYDEVIARFGDAAEPILRESVARAMLNKGAALAGLGRTKQAVAANDEVIARFKDDKEPASREQAARALFNNGVLFGRLGQTTKALAAWNDLLAHFGEAIGPALREQAARALFSTAAALDQLGQTEQAMAVYDDILERVGNAGEPALRALVARALLHKAAGLGRLDKVEQELAAYEEVLARFGEIPEPDLHDLVGGALFGKGVSLARLDRLTPALAALSDFVARFQSTDEPVLRGYVAHALFVKGLVLSQLGQSEQAVAAYDEVLGRLGGATEPSLSGDVARAMVNKGRELDKLGRTEEGLASIGEAFARLGDMTDPELRQIAATALSRKEANRAAYMELGNLLLDYRGDADTALAAYEQGLAATASPGDDTTTTFLHANAAGALALFMREGREDALRHARAALEATAGPLSPSGRALCRALPIWHEGDGVSWEGMFAALTEALDAEDSEVRSTYLDDLQRVLWYVAAQGQGPALLHWMEGKGLADRQPHVYHAMKAIVLGEDHLLSINEETRDPARQIHGGIARLLRLYPSDDGAPKAGRKRRQ